MFSVNSLLALNEVLSFSLPILVVLLFRFWTDPLGWSSWNEANWFGMFLLICLAILWLLVDLYRILRVRRMLRTIEKQNIARLKKIADTGFKLRGWLRKFARRDEEPESEGIGHYYHAKKHRLVSTESSEIYTCGLSWCGSNRCSNRFDQRGEVVSDKIDDKMQEEFNTGSN